MTAFPRLAARRSAPTLALALLSLVLGACGGDDAPEVATAAEAIRVETTTLAPAFFDDILEVSGTVEGVNDAVLSAQAPGTVTFLAALGATVGAGATVAQIDPGLQRAALGSADANVRAAAAGVDRAQATIDQAQASLNFADDTYGRQQRLYRDSIISALEFQQYATQRAQAQAGLAQAQAGLAAARAQVIQSQAGSDQARVGLSQTRVTAPFSGRVEARLVATGRVKVRAGVPERYAGTLRVGDAVDVTVPTADGVRTGRVMFVGGAVDPASRTFPVEVEVGNAENDLKPAMAARLRIRRARVENALVVSRGVVTTSTNGRQVWVVVAGDSGRVAQARTVRLGVSDGTYVVVEEGLKAGDEVIVQGQNDVSAGSAVTVVARQPGYRGPAGPAGPAPRTTLTDTAAVR